MRHSKTFNFILGLIISLVLPLLMALFTINSLGYDNSWESNLDLLRGASLISPLISLSVIINLLAFYFFLKRNNMSAARGVVAGTLIYGIFVLIIKLL